MQSSLEDSVVHRHVVQLADHIREPAGACNLKGRPKRDAAGGRDRLDDRVTSDGQPNAAPLLPAVVVLHRRRSATDLLWQRGALETSVGGDCACTNGLEFVL